MTEEYIITDLMKLGLHRNEARAYRALVELGQSTVKPIADTSGVPRSKVYEVLKGLEDKGLVLRVTGAEPIEFRAVSPEYTIPLLMEKIEGASKSAQRSLESLQNERSSPLEEQFLVLEGEDQIKVEVRRIIAEAKREVFIATLDYSILHSARPALAIAKSNGVEILLLTAQETTEEIDEFRHYLSIQDLKGIPSTTLIEHMQMLLDHDDLKGVGWDPQQISVIVADNIRSLGVFKSPNIDGRPWALRIQNPLIVIFQRQVITAMLSSLRGMLS